jgi:sugar/nucleoside kinase (ribokinase family)
MSASVRPALAIGEVLIDLIAADEATRLEDVTLFAARPGGAPANVAVALSRLGVPSAFCGVVGNDPFGNKLRATLTAFGVDSTRLRSTDAADTTIAFAWKDERGDGRFRLLRLADVLLSPADIAAAHIEQVATIVIGSVALAAEPSRSAIMAAVEAAQAAGVPICFDVNLRPTIWPSVEAVRAACEPIAQRATLLKLSLDDARFLLGAGDPGEALRRLESYGAPFVVLTDGARGAWFAGSRAETLGDSYLPAFTVDAIDPTGAGDAFTAALIARLLAAGWRRLTRDDVRFASAAGALATTRRGAMEALPTPSDIEALLAQDQKLSSTL